MPTKMMLWEVFENKPVSIAPTKLDLEDRLESWIAEDISIISDNLLVIGRQVGTDYGGVIDLICLDPEANTVILELKRHKTPRDIVAQTLDYASWVKDLGLTRIKRISSEFLKDGELEEVFSSKFGHALPDVVNTSHRMLIVASEIDSATERIVKYLSEEHGVDINVATFGYFKHDNKEFLGKSLLLDEEEVQIRADRNSKRQPNLTWEELEEIAAEYNALNLYRNALDRLKPLFTGAARTRSGLSLVGVMGASDSRLNIANMIPGADKKKAGRIGLQIHEKRFLDFFDITKDQLTQVLGEKDPDVIWAGESIYVIDESKLEALIQLLTKV